jgi:methylated-DNA-protein-cysteine methyltransferase-like protein
MVMRGGGPVWAAVYQVVAAVPQGKVTTYGRVAEMLGGRISARAVGWALHVCPEGVPWHRVVNAQGGCSTDRLHDLPPGLQRSLLEAEGVGFRKRGTVDLSRFLWAPRGLTRVEVECDEEG